MQVCTTDSPAFTMMDQVVAVAILLGSVASAQMRIIGGSDCQPHSQPWQVFLFDASQVYCGGVLIDKYWVLTAGHCLGNSTIIFLGLHSLWRKKEGQVIRVARTVRHDAYEPVALNNDIMLLRLNRPANLGARIKPIQLATQCAPVGTKCTVSGWGTTTYPGVKYSHNLQCMEVTILPRKVCLDAYGLSFIESEICAGVIEGQIDSCQGDSGGPLICNGVLHGLVSWGDQVCAAKNRPGVYTEICKFRRWIIRTMTN